VPTRHTGWLRSLSLYIGGDTPIGPVYLGAAHSLNGVLNAYLFDSISEVREITDDWLGRYNEIRPHDALGSLPPARYRERLLAAGTPPERCLRGEIDVRRRVGRLFFLFAEWNNSEKRRRRYAG